jgi:hypothetical protein
MRTTPRPFKIRAFVDGLRPGIDPDKMNQFLDELECEERATSLGIGKNRRDRTRLPVKGDGSGREKG